jgi:hypothetical protein
LYADKNAQVLELLFNSQLYTSKALNTNHHVDTLTLLVHISGTFVHQSITCDNIVVALKSSGNSSDVIILGDGTI